MRPQRFIPMLFLGPAGVAGWLAAPVPAHGDDRAARVVVKTTARDPITGELTALSLKEGITVRREDGTEVTVPVAELVQINSADAPPARPAGPATVLLPDGDRLHGRVVGGLTDALWIETEDLGRLMVPLDGLVAVLLVATSDPAYRRALSWAESSRRRSSDEVQLRNGDVLDGFIQQVNEEAVTLDVQGHESVLPLARIAALRFAGGASRPPDPPYFLMTMRQSGRITLRDAMLRGIELDTRTGFADRLRVPLDRVRTLDLIGGHWDRLPSHDPISFEHTPMLSLSWPYQTDRNVRGGALRVAGEAFERGIGVHSRSRLIYDLRGQYREFVTSFGMDDDSGPLADVTVLIVVDGQRRFDQKNVRAGKLYGPVRLDVVRARQLELIVDFGENGDLQDRFNWIDPALIK